MVRLLWIKKELEKPENERYFPELV